MTVRLAEKRAALIKATQAWLDYQALLDRIDRADLERPNTVGFWSGRDVVTHIANWQEHGIWLLEQWESGRSVQYSYDFDQSDMARWDQFNEEKVSPYRDHPLDDVYDYAIRTHFHLLNRAAESPFADEQFIKGMTWGHYDVHHDDLLGCRSTSEAF